MNSLKDSLEKVLNEILTLSEISKKSTVFTIGIAPRQRENEEIFFPFIRESTLSVIGNVEVTNIEEAKSIVEIIDGIVDYILIDDEKKSKELFNLTTEIKKIAKDSIVLTYKDNDAWVEATDALINLFLEDNLNKKILIFTINNLSIKLALKLCERGSNIYLTESNIENVKTFSIIECLNFVLPKDCPSKINYCEGPPLDIHFDVVIGFSINKPVIFLEFIKGLSKDTMILDAGIGSISEDAIKYALDNNYNIFRLDMRAGLSGNIINVIESYDLRKNVYGKKKFLDFNIVAGGFFGLRGDIVVDSIKNPTKVIGVADGKGNLMNKENAATFKERIKNVEDHSIQNLYD